MNFLKDSDYTIGSENPYGILNTVSCQTYEQLFSKASRQEEQIDESVLQIDQDYFERALTLKLELLKSFKTETEENTDLMSQTSEQQNEDDQVEKKGQKQKMKEQEEVKIFNRKQVIKILEQCFQTSIKTVSQKYEIPIGTLGTWKRKVFGSQKQNGKKIEKEVIQWWIKNSKRQITKNLLGQKMDEVGRKYLKKKSNEWLKDFLKNNKEVITKYSLKLKT